MSPLMIWYISAAGVSAWNGRWPVKQLEEYDAERVDVGLRRYPVAEQFGRHVGQRADVHHLRRIVGGPVGSAEIADLWLRRGRHTQVGRLDVAMHDAGVASVVERAGAL